MTQQHPIAPPPELVQVWSDEALSSPTMFEAKMRFALRAAQWGSDRELKECCSLALVDPCCGTKFQRQILVRKIKEARRPKLPSLKEQALEALESLKQRTTDPNIIGPLHRALEQLND